jgi:hypothetical protein
VGETNIWKEISKIKNGRRKVYFQWKNKIENLQVDYGALTLDEMIDKCNSAVSNYPITDTDTFLAWCKRWESSPEYKRLMCLLKEDSFAMDILNVYESVKAKALDGDSQAIKNMLLLQGEIKKYRQSIDEYFKVDEEPEQEQEEQDDGLII